MTAEDAGEQLPNNDEANKTSVKSHPTKILPTDRLGFEKQLGVLRGYAVAGTADRNLVANRDVSAIVGIHDGTISNCNPSFNDVGFIEREGMKYRPSEVVLQYATAHDWDSTTGAYKLAPALTESWFGKLLLPRLAFRSLSKDEAIGILADAASATKDYKLQIETILDYLRVAGLITVEGNTVTGTGKVSVQNPGTGAVGAQPANSGAPTPPTPQNPNIERFTIPIPGKLPAQIEVPKDLSSDDWEMLQVMLKAYVVQLQKVSAKKTGGDDL